MENEKFNEEEALKSINAIFKERYDKLREALKKFEQNVPDVNRSLRGKLIQKLNKIRDEKEKGTYKPPSSAPHENFEVTSLEGMIIGLPYVEVLREEKPTRYIEPTGPYCGTCQSAPCMCSDPDDSTLDFY